jgi:hypothetical protein
MNMTPAISGSPPGTDRTTSAFVLLVSLQRPGRRIAAGQDEKLKHGRCSSWRAISVR